MTQADRPKEQEAVRTTIVGGRPPGSGKPLGPIPRGVEVLLKKAAVDPDFRRTLLARRADAADEIGLALDPAEAAMLRAAPAAQLEAIIDRTSVEPSLRSAFLGRAAAVMLVALGAGTAGCEPDAPPPTKGIGPDLPPVRALAEAGRRLAAGPSVTASASAAETPAPKPPPPPEPGTRGVRPDRPPAPTGIQPDRPPTPAPPSPPAPPAPRPAESAPAEPAAVRTILVPAAWSSEDLASAVFLRLKPLADAYLPGHALAYANTDGDRRVRIEYRAQTYDVPRPTGKAGEASVTRRETGPSADGLILTVWLERETGQAVRPQVLDNAGLWKTRLDEARVEPLGTYLKINVDYGDRTPGVLVRFFGSPAAWFTVAPPESAVTTQAHRALPPEPPTFEPAGARPRDLDLRSAGVRPDRPAAATFGIQPQRPPTTKGIQPDRPPGGR